MYSRKLVIKMFKSAYGIAIFLDFHLTKQGLPLVDSWSRGLN